MLTSSNPEYILGCKMTVEAMEKQPALSIFSEEACSFLQNVSALLMKTGEAKGYSDVMTFAFWCRKASLRQLAKIYAEEGLRFGRGIVFHITPSNMALNFAYSMTASILAGNASIVRLPSREFPQVKILCDVMKQALENVPQMKPYLVLVRYGHEKDITDAFSRICDVRVIWGGDRTIGEIRSSPMKPRAGDIAFPDRYSMTIIDGNNYLEEKNKYRIAKDFYNDTYLTDQNACTSPRIVVWIGEKTEKAREIFWGNLRESVEREHYELESVHAVDKFTRLCLLGAAKKAHWRKKDDNVVLCVETASLDEEVAEYLGHSGFFLEYVADSLEEILPVCGERCQTLSYYGVEKEVLEELIARHRPRGIDRIVPMGRTMDFSLYWDGHDLIREMSRKIYAI